MSWIRVKICGITSFEDLHMAVEAGADAVGFIVDVPQSPRNLPIKKAEELINATPIFVETVAVTIPKSPSRLENICKELNPSIIQVHGSNRVYKEIRERMSDKPLINVIQVESALKIDTVLEAAKMSDAILADSHVPGSYGGTGKTHNWELSKRIRKTIYPKPLILAGGLTPENIEEAIKVVKPYAVDVSSGVESHPGSKNRKKILEFIKKTRKVEIL